MPADAKALIIAPNLVAARFIQLTPAYRGGATIADVRTSAPTALRCRWSGTKSRRS